MVVVVHTSGFSSWKYTKVWSSPMFCSCLFFDQLLIKQTLQSMEEDRTKLIIFPYWALRIFLLGILNFPTRKFSSPQKEKIINIVLYPYL